MAAKKGESINKESDKFTSMGTSAVNRAIKIRDKISTEMKKDGMKEAVMEFLFSKDPDAVSPLDHLRQ